MFVHIELPGIQPPRLYSATQALSSQQPREIHLSSILSCGLLSTPIPTLLHSALAFADIDGMDALVAIWMLFGKMKNFMVDYLIGFQHMHTCLMVSALRGKYCYVPFHSSDSDLLSVLILDSIACHHYYASRIFSLSFHITFLLYLFTPVSDQKPDIRL